MRFWTFFKTYVRIFILFASPFLILYLCRSIITIDKNLIVYGFFFSLIVSLLLAINLREVHFTVKFNERQQYLKVLTEILADLGYTHKFTNGLLTAFESRHNYLAKREIHVYLFKDTAKIIAPNKYKPIIQRGPKSGLFLLLDYFA